MSNPTFMTQKEIEREYFVASCYFTDLPKGTKFHTYGVTFSLQYEKVTKTDAVIQGRKSRFYKPKSRKVFLIIPRNKYIDFLEKNPHTIPSIKELIELHNRP